MILKVKNMTQWYQIIYLMILNHDFESNPIVLIDTPFCNKKERVS